MEKGMRYLWPKVTIIVFIIFTPHIFGKRCIFANNNESKETIHNSTATPLQMNKEENKTNVKGTTRKIGKNRRFDPSLLEGYKEDDDIPPEKKKAPEADPKGPPDNPPDPNYQHVSHTTLALPETRPTKAGSYTWPKFKNRNVKRTPPVLGLTVHLSHHCDYTLYYCLKAYNTGRVCARTDYYSYYTFRTYCHMEYANCHNFDMWNIIHLGPCHDIALLSEYNWIGYRYPKYLYEDIVQDYIIPK